MTHHPVPRPGDGEAIRASDADRDAVAGLLSTALSEGRLDIGEYEQRLDLAMNATTRGELVPLTSDLPVPDGAEAAPQTTQGSNAAPARAKWREYANEWRYWLGGAIIMVGIWAVTGADISSFWPAIPLGIWGVILIAGLVWPDDGEDEDEDDEAPKSKQTKKKEDDWDF
jgi:hypothetical protein